MSKIDNYLSTLGLADDNSNDIDDYLKSIGETPDLLGSVQKVVKKINEPDEIAWETAGKELAAIPKSKGLDMSGELELSPVDTFLTQDKQIKPKNAEIKQATQQDIDIAKEVYEGRAPYDITGYKPGIEWKSKEQYIAAQNPALFSEEKKKRMEEGISAVGFMATGIKKVPGQGLLPIPEKIGKGIQKEMEGVVGGIKNPEFQNASINNVMRALKEAKPLRGQQEALYSAERAQRAAKAAAMGQKVSGQAGLYAQLGQLKGELPKVQFESIKGKVTQNNVDALFQKIEDNKVLGIFEKINAKKALDKLVGGRGGALPTKGEIALLTEIFPPEFISTVLEKRPLMMKMGDLAGQAINLPRAMMATADLSAPLRQGIFLVGRPKQWLPAFRDMFKYAASEKAYQGMTESIKARPTYKSMREAGLSLTDMGSNMLQREEAFMSNLAERIPVFGYLARASNRAYTGFLNKLRADVFDDLVNSAAKINKGAENPKQLADIAKFVNSATGRGEYRSQTAQKLLVATNGIFFSPRLMASRLNMLNPLYYASLDPFVRKEALKSLFAFATTAGTVLGLAKIGGAEVGVDPRSTDFGKVKIGNKRFDTLGGFQQYIVAASRLISNQMVSSTTGKQYNLGEGWKPTTRADIIQRFFESKGSPVASLALALIKGKTFGGEDIDLPVEITDRFIPMLAQDMYDLYKEEGIPGLAMGMPGAFGVGSQTYGEQIPLATKTAKGKPTIEWKQRPGLGEDIVNFARGKSVEPVPIKAVYDRVQELIKQGKKDDAQIVVNKMSDEDYALYKKFKEKDRKIAFDELKIKMKPVYDQIQGYVKQGREDIAQGLVDQLSDEEYRAYKYFRESDYKLIK